MYTHPMYTYPIYTPNVHIPTNIHIYITHSMYTYPKYTFPVYKFPGNMYTYPIYLPSLPSPPRLATPWKSSPLYASSQCTCVCEVAGGGEGGAQPPWTDTVLCDMTYSIYVVRDSYT